jgi:hypothetical protein
MTVQAAPLITATTAGATSDAFDVDNGANVAVRLSGAAAVLAGAETATVQYKDRTGTWRNLVDAITGAAQITAGENSVTIAQRGTFRVVLTATAALTGIEIISNNAA